jgi:hypothetical protein
MSRVVFDFSMSVDGFVTAAPQTVPANGVYTFLLDCTAGPLTVHLRYRAGRGAAG